MAKQGAMFRLTILLIVVAIVVIYSIFNSRLLIKGPFIEIYDLKDGQILSEDNLVEIKGRVDNISSLTLNGRVIFVDENSNFNEKILLTNKVNPINICAKDRFGKSVEEKITLVYLGETTAKLPEKIEFLESTEETLEPAKENENPELQE